MKHNNLPNNLLDTSSESEHVIEIIRILIHQMIGERP
jgi:hypothetical protein